MTALSRLLDSPASSRGILAARAIVAAHALWITVSRPCLPMLFQWPAAFWRDVSGSTISRYMWSFEWSEKTLYALLLILLPLAIVSRGSSLLSAVLLYHFAPLEDAFITSSGPYSRGLTVDVLALAVLAFTPRLRSAPSGDCGWPVVLVRFAVASQYAWSSIAKLRVSGFSWFAGENMHDLAVTLSMTGIARHPSPVLDHPALAWTAGIGWFVISFGMMLAVLSRRIAVVVVPLTAIAHVLAAVVFGIVWLAAPLLLVFIGWDQSGTPNSSDHLPRA